jgi:hypothetical protein
MFCVQNFKNVQICAWFGSYLFAMQCKSGSSLPQVVAVLLVKHWVLCLNPVEYSFHPQIPLNVSITLWGENYMSFFFFSSATVSVLR